MGSIWVGGVCYLWFGLAPGRALRGFARHALRYSTLVSAVGFALLGRTLVWGALYVVRKGKGVWLYPSGQGTSGTLVGVARLRPRDCALVSAC